MILWFQILRFIKYNFVKRKPDIQLLKIFRLLICKTEYLGLQKQNHIYALLFTQHKSLITRCL